MNGIGFAVLILLGTAATISACHPWEISLKRFVKRHPHQ